MTEPHPSEARSSPAALRNREPILAALRLAFDASLRSRDPAWGLRHLDEVAALAGRHGLMLEECIAMPANNLSLVFRNA